MNHKFDFCYHYLYVLQVVAQKRQRQSLGHHIIKTKYN